MHYHAEVWIENSNDVNSRVSEAMAPYEEENRGGGYGGFWDWYQIGGRYKGTHVVGYDSETDPAHKETCRLCNGTGLRDDNLGKQERLYNPDYRCNGCGGVGISTKWPTDWKRHDKDVILVSELYDGISAYTAIIPNKVAHSDGRNAGGVDVKRFLHSNGITVGYIVTVDYHS